MRQTRFAAIIAQKLAQLGLDIPEDLRLLAANEQEFKELTFKKKHGIEQEHQSTVLLKEALAAGQKTKKGIGFKPTGKKKRQDNIVRHSDDEDLIDKYREMVDLVKQREHQMKANLLHGEDRAVVPAHQTYVVQKKASRFSDAAQAAPGAPVQTVVVSAEEYHQAKLEDFKASLKSQLKEKFRASFVQRGQLTFDRPAPKAEADAEDAADDERSEERANEHHEGQIETVANIDDIFRDKDKFDEHLTEDY